MIISLRAVFSKLDVETSRTINGNYYDNIAKAFLEGVCAHYHGQHALALYGAKIGRLSLHLDDDVVPHIKFKVACPDGVDSDDMAQDMKAGWIKAVGFDCETYVWTD